MKQEIDFKGLSHNPSDHECVEGDLGAVVNLIPEDGALRPVTLEGKTVGTIPSTCRIVSTHRGNGYRHWILECVENGRTLYKWMPVGGSEASGFFLGDDFTANDVTCIGNMICFVGDAQTKYAIWRNNNYQVISMRDLTYNIDITNDVADQFSCDEAVDMGDDFLPCFKAESDAEHPATDSEGIPLTIRHLSVTKDGASRIWSALDAKLREKLSEETGEYLRHIVIGVAAVRLYDGNLVNVSDFFTLLPHGAEKEVEVDRPNHTVRCKTWAHGHRIKVSMFNKSIVKDLVRGVSIFLTTGDLYLKLDKAYEVELTTGTMPAFHGSFSYDRLSDDELYKAVDGESFFLMDTIEMNKIGTIGNVDDPGVEVTMHEVTGAETAMTLANLRRGDIGGDVCYAYNNRLHIGGVRETVGTPMEPRIYQHWPYNILSSEDCKLMGEILDDAPVSLVDIAIRVKCMSGGQLVTFNYAIDLIHYPFEPIFEIPYANATEAEVILRIYSIMNEQYTYFRKVMTLHQSDSWGCSYHIDFGRYGWRVGQVYAFDENGATITRRIREDWVQVAGELFDEIYNAVAPAVLPSNPSLLKVSEVENPLVWPSGGTVSVGNGQIMAMASNTESVSDGQFGEYLHVFTDEGVWLLSVDRTSGLYTMAREVSRDVLTDAASITPMDKGVLYTTTRGLMSVYGNSTKCLSDSLRGVPWQMLSMPHAADVVGIRKAGDTGQSVSYVRLGEFLSGARILYDYSKERVFVFHPIYEYAYVLSLRSGLWGAVESHLMDTVPSSSYAMVEKTIQGATVREIVEIGGDTDVRIGVLACTRPMAFGEPHVHKSVMAAVVRGLFHGRGSGEKSRIGCMLFGSNDLYHWHAVMSSNNQYLHGRIGTPYQWWRICVVGAIDESETLDGVTFDVKERLRNRIR